MSLETQVVVNYIKRQPPSGREKRLRELVRDFPTDWLKLVDRLLHEEMRARNHDALPSALTSSPYEVVRITVGPVVF